MSQSDVDILKRQVSNLSTLLSRYQEAYPNFVLEENEISKEEAKDQPWYSVSNQLNPLFREYDATIFGLEKKISDLQDEIQRLRTQAKDLINENERHVDFIINFCLFTLSLANT
ncbi:uncharacterized protein LOC131935075 [Physella acuta]|uniref:uncharacterized protein LOC131935075 n=1 Tax=Physella acuta TaxID=109671 RepID=UPI0027DD3398|nr:uncharacterized protein LOC131935075 [Physella acuta]